MYVHKFRNPKGLRINAKSIHQPTMTGSLLLCLTRKSRHSENKQDNCKEALAAASNAFQVRWCPEGVLAAPAPRDSLSPSCRGPARVCRSEIVVVPLHFGPIGGVSMCAFDPGFGGVRGRTAHTAGARSEEARHDTATEPRFRRLGIQRERRHRSNQQIY